MDEGAVVFAALRSRASASPSADGSYRWRGDDEGDALQEDVRRLLNGIEEKSAYFDRVKAAKKKIEKTFGVPDFLPLGELLQIRRDFWAASEIFLIDDIRALGAELAEVRSYEAFRAEALALLFKDEDDRLTADADPVELRIALAREEAAAFVTQVEQAIAVEREKSRFPRPAEIVAAPLGLIKAAAFVVREGRTIFSDAAASARSFARTVGAKGLKAAAKELRKARGELPGQFASAFERAGGLARKGGGGLKRHYEFVLEAQELRARYAELLARRAPRKREGQAVPGAARIGAARGTVSRNLGRRSRLGAARNCDGYRLSDQRLAIHSGESNAAIEQAARCHGPSCRTIRRDAGEKRRRRVFQGAASADIGLCRRTARP